MSKKSPSPVDPLSGLVLDVQAHYKLAKRYIYRESLVPLENGVGLSTATYDILIFSSHLHYNPQAIIINCYFYFSSFVFSFGT